MELLSLQYLFYLVLFIFASFVAFYIPGNLFLHKATIDRIPRIVLSFSLGLILWAFQGYVFGYLGFRELSYAYLLVFGIPWIKINLIDNKLKIPKLNISRKHTITIALILFAVLTQSLFAFLNGVKVPDGIYFCCGLPDSLYHIGLTNALVNNFPPYEPATIDVLVKNYHYLSNLINAELIRVFHLPLVFTQYQFMFVLITTLIGLSAVALSDVLKMPRVFANFLILFIFFAGDIVFLMAFLAGKGLNFNLGFLYDGTDMWYSPPRAFAVLITFASLCLFVVWNKTKSIYLGILLAVLFSSLIGLKVYIGLTLYLGLAVVSLYYLFKKEFKAFVVPVLTLIIALAIYLPVNSGSGGLEYIGTWRVTNFISQPEFGLTHLELARQIFVADNNTLRIVLLEIFYTLLYFIFVFGVLNISFMQSKKSLKMFPKELNLLLLPAIIFCFIFGFLFFQHIANTNTSQFLISAEMFASLYAALACTVIYKKLGKFGVIFVVIIVLLAIPKVTNKSINRFNEIRNGAGLRVSNAELEAINYLKNNSPKNSVILSDDEALGVVNYCYYIGFLTDRRLFLCDAKGILGDHGVFVDDKYKEYQAVIENLNSTIPKEILFKNNVDYLYLKNAGYQGIDDKTIYTKVFENDEIVVVKVKRN
jgi:hypothetical protein